MYLVLRAGVVVDAEVDVDLGQLVGVEQGAAADVQGRPAVAVLRAEHQQATRVVETTSRLSRWRRGEGREREWERDRKRGGEEARGEKVGGGREKETKVGKREREREREVGREAKKERKWG